MPLNILVVGAGCAGPALALLLRKSNPNHMITVIERFASLRTGGQQLDVKVQGIPISNLMGVMEGFKAAAVEETGVSLVDKNGKSLMRFGVNDASESPRKGFGFTNEYEIMRGDMVQVVYDASLAHKPDGNSGELKYKFDTTITALEQSTKGVNVTFSDGQAKHFDLVVAADGQNSRTRRMVFGDETNAKVFRSLGVHAAYYEIPRAAHEDNDARAYFAPGNRQIITRTGNRSTTQVYFFVSKEEARHEHMKEVNKQSIAQQKEAWSEIFHDAGWECERFIAGLKTTNDFYAHEIGQVHMPRLYKDRVVLLGDAGYCPSPFTGMGTTLSFIGAYVLAGELARHPDDVDAALQAYHEVMQAPLEEYQKVDMSQMGLIPTSALGLSIVSTILWTLSCLRVDKLAAWAFAKMPQGKKDEWVLPEYPELGLKSEERV